MSNIVWGFPTPNQTVIDGLVIDAYYVEIQSMMSLGTLKPGATYRIKGFNKNMPVGSPENPNGYLPEVLYDDGTNSGITIIMQAVSPTEMATSGYGEFYNPKYGDETTYNNTDGTGLYRIWDGNNPEPLDIPAYQVDDVVFWGGYAWKNLTGIVGVDDDILNLDSTNWEKLPYSNSTWYELVVDEIKVDWNYGILVERCNPENQVIVSFNTNDYYYYGLYDTVKCSPISLMAWGLYSKYAEYGNNYYGIGNVEVVNSFFQTVSFKGNQLARISMINWSYIYDNYWGKECSLYGNRLDYSYMYDNELTNNSRISDNDLNYGAIESNILNNVAYIVDNYVQASSISYNNLDNNSYILANNCIAASISYNILSTNCRIETNDLSNFGYIEYNNLSANGFIRNNIINNYSNIEYNVLTNGCLISDNSVAFSSKISFTNTLNNKFVRYNNIIRANVNVDISAATIIYGDYTKEIFARQDGTLRLSYFNNSDVLTVVAVNA